MDKTASLMKQRAGTRQAGGSEAAPVPRGAWHRNLERNKHEAAGFSIVAEARGYVVFPGLSAGADYSESTATSRYETWIGPFVVDPDR